MSNIADYLWLIPALPLLASALTALIAFLGPPALRRQAHWPCILGAVGACVVSFFVLAAVSDLPRLEGESGERSPGAVERATEEHAQAAPGAHEYIKRSYTWIHAGEVDVGFELRADGLTAIMLVTVTFISSLIAIYSVGYMHGDEGYPRFFAEVALFIFSMTLLVLANNFLLLYAGWEGVGLCSYLLIGFWFTKPSAAAAARKAFLVTRLGDMGMLLGIILLWWMANFKLDYDTVFNNLAHADPYLVGGACLLLFCGAVGKSAQFPLYVWLPDAMEGPTPVSALIHAATMVTAGAYLVARCTPLFVQVPAVQLVVACIGCFTALLAALIALTQTDLKRVLAYSTISQLGYMFLGLGSGAVVGGIFHLYTHAFFKALLFLAAGSVMHAMGGVIDMRRFRGLRRLMPWTAYTFLAGALALAGFPLLSGFWSKDEILGGALANYLGGHLYGDVYLLLFLVGLFTAGLTAFYTFRAYFLTFEGPERIPEEAGHHSHESPPVMTAPLAVLAVGAVGAGWIELYDHSFSNFIRLHTVGLNRLAENSAIISVMVTRGVMVTSGVIALVGIAIAWWIYLAREGLAGQIAARIPVLYQLSLNKFHVDELYDAFLVKPLEGFAVFCRVLDLYVVDGLVDLVGHVPRLFGALFRPVQNGLVQFYALAMILGLTVFLLALISKL
jgi:NADH-quinone oxidoreductase subunit L